MQLLEEIFFSRGKKPRGNILYWKKIISHVTEGQRYAIESMLKQGYRR